ncbi:MAG: hypothetical protein RRZ24_07230 [Clostridia bacterium]
MALLISDIKLPITAEETELQSRIAKQCGFDYAYVRKLRIVRRVLDARKKSEIHFLIRAIVEMDAASERRLLQKQDDRIRPYFKTEQTALHSGSESCRGRIAIIGLGPAGLFAGLLLAQHGYAPLIIERGKPVETRVRDVEQFWLSGALQTESNVMFGEGGAGTFSDGKLTSRSKDTRQEIVLETFQQFGAPEDILVDGKPHIGTDRLRKVVSGIRHEIERLGGEVRFSTRLTGIENKDGRLSAIHVTDAAANMQRIAVSAVALAIGQGARDTYRMLFDAGVAMGKKPFAVGIRMEHPQSLIDVAQYGALAGHPRLGAASYALTSKSGVRGVYTFCMCPGGRVIASSSDVEQVVVNGMSNHARDGQNANAAVVVQVHDADTADHPLAGLQFVEQMERAAYIAGGGGYSAPAERTADFLQKTKPTAFGTVIPSYRPGVMPVSLWDCLPDFVAQGVADGIVSFARQLRGYDLGDAVLTAVETRTSAPLRILRGENLESVSHSGLYPIGEGAGYAGGIVSAAIDGLRAAERIIERFAKP